MNSLKRLGGIVAAATDLRLAHLLHCRSGDDGGEWLGAFFVAETWTGTPILREPHKHDAIDWFDIDDVPATTIDYTRQGIRGALTREPFSTLGFDRSRPVAPSIG